MRYQAIAAALILCSGSLFAQQNRNFTPPNFKEKIPTVVAKYVAPKVDNNAEEAKAASDQSVYQDKMLRFGKEIATDINFLSVADQFVLPNGNRVSQYIILCKGAKSINLILSNFHLASGALLYMTDANKREFVGAYTSINNNEAKVLGTELLKTDEVVVVLEEPKGSFGQSSLTISTVVHGFLDLEEMAKGLNTSGDCNVDVNCPAGAGWESQRNSVAMMVNGGGFCTGSLVNNTSGQIIPYFITARHCGTNPANWVFRFRWESPQGQTVCAGTSNSGNGPTTMNVNGGVMRANNNTSDFLLVQLNAKPDSTWGVYYNGWDNTDSVNVLSGTGIHHPDGDIKKISKEDQALTQQTIPFQSAQNRTWVIADWDLGVTEPGSSGSPLFSQDKRLIGVLSGGGAACTGVTDNGQSDFYGRFGYAWNNGANPNERLKEWLDPTNSGATVLDGVDPLIGQDQLDAAVSNLKNAPATTCDPVFTPEFLLLNSGKDTISSVVIGMAFDNVEFNEATFNLQLLSLQSINLMLPTVTAPVGTHSFTVYVKQVNATNDNDTSNNRLQRTVTLVPADFTVHLTLNLDCYASETSWFLRDANSNVLYQSPSYPDDQPDTIELDMCLPYGCYSFQIKDSYGDGMTGCNASAGGNGFYKLTNTTTGGTAAEITEANADFGSTNTQNFCYDTTNVVQELNLDYFVSIYPNPGRNILTVQSQKLAIVQVEIYSVEGKLIGQYDGNELNKVTVNTQAWMPSVYIVRTKTSEGYSSQRWIKN